MDSRISIFLVFCLVSLAIAQTPGQVRSLAISDIQQWGFSASWQEPLDGNTPVRYNVTIESTNPVREAYEMSFEPASNGVYEVDHLYDSSTYSFSVVAVNSDGQAGEAVVESNIVIPPCRICLNMAGINFFTFNIEPTFSEAIRLIGRSVDATSNTEYPAIDVSGDISSLFYFQSSSPLIPGVLYEFEVRRESDDALLAASRYRTTPHPVTNLQVGITGRSVTIQYEQPSQIRENSFGYRISYNDAQGNPLERLVATEDTSVEITDLGVGVLYSFEVQSYSGEFGDRTYSTIESQDISIVALTLQEQGTTSLTVGWTQTVGEVSHLDVFGIFGGSNSTLAQDLFPDATVATIGSLSPGEVYRVTLFISNANGGEDVVASEVFQTTPDVVTNIVGVIMDTSISLTWNSAAGRADYYLVSYDPPYGSTNMLSEVEGNTFQIEGLDPGIQYDVGIVTAAGDGQSAEAVEMFMTAVGDPDMILLKEITATSFAVTWSPRVGASSYTISISPDAGNPPFPIASGQRLFAEFTGLSEGTVYTVTLAIDSIPPVNPLEDEFKTNPSIPGTILITNRLPRSATLSWGASAGADEYAVTVSLGEDVIFAMEVAALSVDVMDLEPETTYSVVVVAESVQQGFISRSGEQTASFETVTPLPGEIVILEYTNTTIEFLWGDSTMEPGFVREEVSYSPMTNSSSEEIISERRRRLVDLRPGVLYTINLKVISSSPMENTTSQRTVPLPPNNLEVVEETPLTVTFSWGLEDTQLDNFVIFYMMNGESTNVTVNSDLRSYTLMNLQPDTMYDFSMVTVSGDEESVSVPARGATVALPPNTILSAETTATTINLWFSPIVGPTGAYDVAVEGMEGPNTIIQPDELLNIQLTGLSPSTVYEIQVNRMTQNYRQSVRTNPPNPGNVTDVEPGRFVVEFSFSPGQPTDAVNFYEIYGEDDGTSRILGNPSCCNQVLLASIPAAAPLTFEATGLNPNTPYVYEIRSLLDSAGDFPMQRSNQVQLVEFTTGSLPLGDLDVREITTTTIDLIWLTTGLESLAFFIIYKQADESTFDTSFTRTEPGTQYAEYTLESLLPGELYTVRLQNEENDLNDEITQRTRPNSITRLTTTARTSTSLSLEWGAADGVLSYYEVVYDPPTIYFPRRTEVQADEPLSLTLSGLFPNTTYTVTVVTWSGTGADETSSAPFTGSFQTASRCNDTRADGFTFLYGIEGEVVDSVETCPINTTLGGSPIGRAVCVNDTASGELIWNITINDCGPIRETSEILDDLTRDGVTNETVIDVLEIVVEITDTDIDEGDIDNIASIISSSTDLGSGDPVITNLTTTIISDIIDVYEENPSNLEESTEAFTEILMSLETQLDNIDTSDDQPFMALKRNLAVQVWSVRPTNFASGLTISVSSTSDDLRDSDITLNRGGSSLVNKAETRVDIPPGVLNDRADDNAGSSEVRLSLTVFRTSSLYSSARVRETNSGQNSFNRSVNSLIVGLAIGGRETTNLREDTVFQYTPLQPGFENPECNFWDFEDNDWSQRGCRRITSSVDTEKITCCCNHLTNFAVLMDIYAESFFAFGVISIIGATISVVCLIIILISNKIALPRSYHKHQSQKFFVGQRLCWLLLFLYIEFFFFAAFERHPDHRDLRHHREVKHVPSGIRILQTLTIFYTLCTMAWMSVEGIYTSLSVAGVSHAYIAQFMLKAGLVTWGGCGLIVLITGLAAMGHYTESDYCYLQRWPTTDGLLILLALILFANIIIFGLVVRHLFESANVGSKHDSIPNSLKASIGHIKGIILLLILFGLTLVTGYLTLINNTTTEVIRILFTDFASLLGFFLFVYHCAKNPEVPAYWARMCECGRNSPKDSTGSRTGRPTSHLSSSTNMHEYSSSMAHFSQKDQDQKNPASNEYQAGVHDNPAYEEIEEGVEVSDPSGKYPGKTSNDQSAVGPTYEVIEEGGAADQGYDYPPLKTNFAIWHFSTKI